MAFKPLAYRPPPAPVGRPTLFDRALLQKLEEAFAIGASDKEACFYANVSPAALYKYQETHPEFVERKSALKQRPVLVARQTVVKAIETDPDLALKYLERKRKTEFAIRREMTGKGGAAMESNVHLSAEQIDAELTKLVDRRQATGDPALESGGTPEGQDGPDILHRDVPKDV